MGLKSLLCVLVVLSAACVGCKSETQPLDPPATPPAATDTTG